MISVLLSVLISICNAKCIAINDDNQHAAATCAAFMQLRHRESYIKRQCQNHQHCKWKKPDYFGYQDIYLFINSGIIEAQNEICALCNDGTTITIHADHVFNNNCAPKLRQDRLIPGVFDRVKPTTPEDMKRKGKWEGGKAKQACRDTLDQYLQREPKCPQKPRSLIVKDICYYLMKRPSGWKEKPPVDESPDDRYNRIKSFDVDLGPRTMSRQIWTLTHAQTSQIRTWFIDQFKYLKNELQLAFENIINRPRFVIQTIQNRLQTNPPSNGLIDNDVIKSMINNVFANIRDKMKIARKFFTESMGEWAVPTTDYGFGKILDRVKDDHEASEDFKKKQIAYRLYDEKHWNKIFRDYLCDILLPNDPNRQTTTCDRKMKNFGYYKKWYVASMTKIR